MEPLTLFAFLSIYIIWGSTYLGIKIAGETLPPFLLAGARFIVAGLAMMAWARWRNAELPTRREWLGATGVGICLVVLSNAPIVWVERTVDSGLVALFTAASPILISVFTRMRTGIPIGRRKIAGMAFGSVGIAVLASATLEATADPWPLIVVLLSVASWAFGSTYGLGWPQPRNLVMQSGAQMATGGLLAFLIGIIAGELTTFDPATVSTRSVLAWLYLTLFGSMLAYTCYQWLMRHVEPTKVATSTYVNPVVAVLLGVTIGGEALNSRIGLAMLLLVPGVALVVTAPKVSALER